MTEAQNPKFKTKPGAVKKKKLKLSFFTQVIILGVVNLLCVFGIIIILGGLLQKAEDIKGLRSLNLKLAAQSNVSQIEADIFANKAKVDKLSALFPNESQLIDFVKEIDRLKKEGVVGHFSFVSNAVVLDKTKLEGLPLMIEFRGSFSQVDAALQGLQRLPFLLRAVNVQIKQEADKDWVDLKYGGILYVSETFAKN